MDNNYYYYADGNYKPAQLWPCSVRVDIERSSEESCMSAHGEAISLAHGHAGGGEEAAELRGAANLFGLKGAELSELHPSSLYNYSYQD